MKSFLQKKIERYLDTTGLSVAAFERKAELKINVARNILRGQSKRPSAQTLQAVANAMGCTVQDLLGVKSEGMKADGSLHEEPLLVESPQILQEALESILKVMIDNNYPPTLQQTLHILGEVYAYSIKKDPPKIDMDFVEWFIKRAIN